MKRIRDLEIVKETDDQGEYVPDTSAPGILSLLLTVLVELESE
jgi:hypothetical protein